MSDHVTTHGTAEPPPTIQEISLSSWDAYRPTITDIERQLGHRDKGIGFLCENCIAYRGQQSARWPLKTTLEREVAKEFTATTYFECATRYHRDIESITGREWPLPTLDELPEIVNRNAAALWVHTPAYPYLVYLRHHGFPSPLLDWSLSAYVAAFFAFEGADPKSDDRVAIYTYIETPHGTKAGFVGAPTITLHGPRVTTDRRHFMQQSVYTWCVKRNDERNDYEICSHSDVLRQPNAQQDMLIRITLPASEKRTALRDLHAHNITHYTLFGSEDALAKTLAMRAFLLD